MVHLALEYSSDHTSIAFQSILPSNHQRHSTGDAQVEIGSNALLDRYGQIQSKS